MGGSAADTPTSRALAGAFLVTPLLSQAANGHRAGSTHPKRANPGRRQELRESPRPVSYGDATSDQPGRRLRSLHTSRNFQGKDGLESRRYGSPPREQVGNYSR